MRILLTMFVVLPWLVASAKAQYTYTYVPVYEPRVPCVTPVYWQPVYSPIYWRPVAPSYYWTAPRVFVPQSVIYTY